MDSILNANASAQKPTTDAGVDQETRIESPTIETSGTPVEMMEKAKAAPQEPAHVSILANNTDTLNGDRASAPGTSSPPMTAKSNDTISSKLRSRQLQAPPLGKEEQPAKKSKRRGGRASSREFLAIVDGLFSFLMIIALGLGILGASFNSKFLAPGPFKDERTVLIPPRSGVNDIAEILKRNELIEDTTVFRIGTYVNRGNEDLKAGEYLIPKAASMRQIIDILRSGQSIQYGITIPEGLTSFQIVQRLREVDVLAGEIRQIPPEGSLLPDTYRVTRGTGREAVVLIMQRAQRRVLEDAWKRRQPNLPLRSADELLVLASIVERETGQRSERPRVAAVFVNRLNKRIRLQSDPTTIYGIVGGQGTLGRGLTRSEIDRATPYNTYVIAGLPPTPIANPGREAIEAAANPARSNDLYFVADGTGGHTFSETLDQHNRAVARWRGIERSRADGQPAESVDIPAGSIPAQPTLPVRQAPRRQPNVPPIAGTTPAAR